MGNSNLKTIIEKITEEQIIEILAELGSPPYKVKDKEIWFRTVCHGGDSHKLCYFRESKSFYCYTNCGKMSLFDFIGRAKNLSFSDTVRYLSGKVHLNIRRGFAVKKDKLLSQDDNKEKHKNAIRKRKREKTTFDVEPIPTYNDNIMNYFEDVYYQGWIDEGITIETMQKFNIKWYETGKHIIIPHYNYNGGLVGIRRRTLLPEEIPYGKYMPETISEITYSHALGLNLYGLNENKEAIKRAKRIILVEGEKSVLLSNSYYGDESIAVATCGFTVSNWQRDMILSLGVQEVVIAFDKDFNPNDFERDGVNKETQEYKEYSRFADRIVNIGMKFNNQCQTYAIWDRSNLLSEKNSPFDKGKEVFEKLLDTKAIIHLME